MFNRWWGVDQLSTWSNHTLSSGKRHSSRVNFWVLGHFGDHHPGSWHCTVVTGPDLEIAWREAGSNKHVPRKPGGHHETMPTSVGKSETPQTHSSGISRHSIWLLWLAIFYKEKTLKNLGPIPYTQEFRVEKYPFPTLSFSLYGSPDLLQLRRVAKSLRPFCGHLGRSSNETMVDAEQMETWTFWKYF